MLLEARIFAVQYRLLLGKKKKLQRFAEIRSLPNVVEVEPDGARGDHPLKGQWGPDFFGDSNPLVLELGCGKGEYTVGLARSFPDFNFLGVDIKGDRIWKGAHICQEENVSNAGFLRTRVEFIERFFGPEEIDAIWLPFSDPQPKKRQRKKRLVAPAFLGRYKAFLKPGGTIHLKTDNSILFEYAMEVVEAEGHEFGFFTRDLYGQEAMGFLGNGHPAISIQTHYELKAIEGGSQIRYLCFRLQG